MASRQRGELETSVLAVLWASEVPLSASEIRSGFDEPVPAATTVITVLERLRAKGLVERGKPASGSYVYKTTANHNEHIAESMATALAQSSDRTMALMNFTGQLSNEDKDILRRMLDGRE